MEITVQDFGVRGLGIKEWNRTWRLHETTILRTSFACALFCHLKAKAW